jgi:drug/metabolite transporter superfamily protein YnfA
MAIQEHRWRFLFLVYLFMLLALLSKEAKVALIPLLPLYVWLFVRPLRWSYLLGSFAATVGSIGFLFLLQRAITHEQPTGFTYITEPAAIQRNLAAHFWSFSNWLVHQDQDVVMPAAVQSMAEALPGQAILLLYLLLSLLLLTFHQHLPNSGRVFALGGLTFLLAVLPYSFFADRLFMRYGYFGHVGLAVTVAAASAWSVAWLRNAWPLAQPERLSALAARWFRAA